MEINVVKKPPVCRNYDKAFFSDLRDTFKALAEDEAIELPMLPTEIGGARRTIGSVFGSGIVSTTYDTAKQVLYLYRKVSPT